MKQRRKKSLATLNQEVPGFFKDAPERALRLCGMVGPTSSGLAKEKIGKTRAMVERLADSLALLDDAVELLEQQYIRREKVCGRKPTKQEIAAFILKWLSEPSEPKDSCKYLRPSKRKLICDG